MIAACASWQIVQKAVLENGDAGLHAKSFLIRSFLSKSKTQSLVDIAAAKSTAANRSTSDHAFARRDSISTISLLFRESRFAIAARYQQLNSRHGVTGVLPVEDRQSPRRRLVVVWRQNTVNRAYHAGVPEVVETARHYAAETTGQNITISEKRDRTGL